MLKYKKIKLHNLICIVCGQKFLSKDKRKNKCSKKCLKKYLSDKKKENWKDQNYRINQSRKIKEGQNNELTKLKMSLRKKGQVTWNIGRHLSEERKKHQSEVMKGRVSPNKGKKLSEEEKLKISQSVKIIMNTPEMKNKVKKGLAIYFNDEERRNKAKEKEYNTRKKNHTIYKDLCQNKEWMNKVTQSRNETKQKNKSFNTSKPEIDIYQLLLQKFGENDIEWNYKSKEYPFMCDFYIKSMNLYIEYQGHWTHGKEPYDKNNVNHQEIVNKWISKNTRFYNKAIKVWTIRDPLKRKTAKDNKLNWVEFFDMISFKDWIRHIK